MLTILPLQLLFSCIFAMLIKSTDCEGQMVLLQLLYFKYEALMSLRHASVLSDSLQNVFIPPTQLAKQVSQQLSFKSL